MLAFIAFAVVGAPVPQFAVYYPGKASPSEQLAAKEIRRYVYLRTGVLVPLQATDAVSRYRQGIVIGTYGQPIGKRLWATDKRPSDQGYILKTSGKLTLIGGGSDLATLYGAYAYAEKLGARFYLHGDVLPSVKTALTTLSLNERHEPLFNLRGILPFHDFPEGPDWWNEDDYKATISRLPKLGMNFIGLHTYPEPIAEPTVWIGRPQDLGPKGEIVRAYTTAYFNTLRSDFGFQAKATSAFAFGASELFEMEHGPNAVMAGLTPKAQSPQQQVELFNRTGKLLNEAFTWAHRWGVKTCVGTETPLPIPAQVKALGKASPQDYYEALFKRIGLTYPIDYYWFWTPEGWTWGGNTQQDVQATLDDIRSALRAKEKVKAPFTLATSGWVLGPQSDRAFFDKALPKDMPISCINRQVGAEPIDVGFADISGRPKWAIPWMEDDPAMTAPQLWAARMRRDAQDSLKYGCTGLLGIHWRTHIIAPNVSSLAKAGWDQKAWGGSEKTTWEARGGTVVSYANEIEGTNEPAVYQDVRFNLAGYRFGIPNGNYRVTLKFSEVAHDQPGKRVFGVKINGKTVIDSLDIFATAGKNHAYDRIFEVNVVNGVLRIDFVAKVEFPCISAIVIRSNETSLKVNCGGPAYGDYLSDIGGKPDPSVRDFYEDWASAEFGPAVAKPAADLFCAIDGKLPRPLTWTDGPGGITPDPRKWKDVAAEYAFVNQFRAIRDSVQGGLELQRFDYWLRSFEYLKLVGELRCVWSESNDAKGPEIPRLKRKLVELVASIYDRLLANVDSAGELGNLANWEQHLLPTVLGAQAKMSQTYRGPLRVFMPTVREVISKGETLTIHATVLSSKPIKKVVVLWRQMGKGEFKTVEMEHIARGIYRVNLPMSEDIEYRVEVLDTAGQSIKYPVVGAQTVVVI